MLITKVALVCAACFSIPFAVTSRAADSVVLQSGTASFSQTLLGVTFSPDQVHDGSFAEFNGWAVLEANTLDGAHGQSAVWETQSDVPPGRLTFTLHFLLGPPYAQHLLGRFRLSVTTADRSTFADGNDQLGQLGSGWIPLHHPTVTVPSGMTVTTLPDFSLLTGGAIPATGQYVVSFDVPLTITGIRLDVIEDPSLTQLGPGHALNGNFLLNEMLVSIEPNALLPYCAGDGVTIACPCGNHGQIPAGCANSVDARGGLLFGSGTPSLSADSLSLNADQLPQSTALYFQGTLPSAGGFGVAFGDGHRCVAGVVVRLAISNHPTGSGAYPTTGAPSVSVRGNVLAPGTRYYQVWYRNAVPYCTASTFNLTNGLCVSWGA